MAERRAMEKLLETLFEHIGYAAPFMYAAAAFYFFRWLDENASDEAKTALARTMRFKDYKNEQIASVLVEVFDRIYSYPLWRWGALSRSLLFTTAVSTIYVFESDRNEWEQISLPWAVIGFFFNALTDYLSLFVIRPMLIRSGAKPVIGLMLGALSGGAIVVVANLLRAEAILIVYFAIFSSSLYSFLQAIWMDLWASSSISLSRFGITWYFVWPAVAVFVWLPLFALGIVTARLMTPLSWVVGQTQWFLKEGNEHPLKAIAYVAAVIVFLGTVAARAVFSAQQVAPGNPL
ncbi:hypothetical protein ACRQ5Q_09105 [Bradyrhizobium sp. PMVTL-01]|uniref:hypothetical protein n=1 Tax=Bradyrhizobium sp. PMVTL-01 TaxID=3434999 RepID=UPI003F6F25F0